MALNKVTYVDGATVIYADNLNAIQDAIIALENGGGGGGGGTTNYNDLTNKPQIGGVTLSGNKSLSDLGAVAADQGVANAGKFIMVGNDGIVAPVAMSVWQGGNY